MAYKSRCHHHFLEFEEEGLFVPEDGIDLLDGGTVFIKWTDSGHIDFPLDIQETNESSLKEKKNHPSSPFQMRITP